MGLLFPFLPPSLSRVVGGVGKVGAGQEIRMKANFCQNRFWMDLQMKCHLEIGILGPGMLYDQSRIGGHFASNGQTSLFYKGGCAFYL